jgi:hypothetical protein
LINSAKALARTPAAVTHAIAQYGAAGAVVGGMNSLVDGAQRSFFDVAYRRNGEGRGAALFGIASTAPLGLSRLGAGAISSESMALARMAENTRLGTYRALDEVINARGAADIRRELDRLVAEGHAVGRHGARVTELALDNRVLHKFDPITGTTTDYFTRGTHRVGNNATKITSNQALVAAEQYIRSTPEFDAAVNAPDALATGFAPVKGIPLSSALGGNYDRYVFGKMRLNTGATGLIDFTDGTLTSVFTRSPNGAWGLHTMYPVPKK